MIYICYLIIALLIGDLTLIYYKKWKVRKFCIDIKDMIKNTGFPLIPVTHNGIVGYMLIDTGANNSFIDLDYLNQLDVKPINEKGHTTGFEGVQKETSLMQMTFKFKGLEYTSKFQVLQIPGFDVFVSMGIPVFGVLGTDFLYREGFVIDYKDLIIYPKK